MTQIWIRVLKWPFLSFQSFTVIMRRFWELGHEALMIVNTLEITAWLFKGHIINPATAQHCDPQCFHIHFKHSDVDQNHN